MIGHTANEQKLYGKTWDTVHGGYFANPLIASPLVEAILDTAHAARPTVLADLGGGTGFLLNEVAGTADWSPLPALVCVDTALDQLECCPQPITTLECAVQDATRDMLVESDGSLMICMRSVLHYLGEERLKPDLGHFRSILEPGEFLVHQTICFSSEEDTAIGNLLYDRMDTGKWFPTVDYLEAALKEEGFKLADIRPAAPICLTSDELEERYGIDHSTMMEIGAEMERLSSGCLSEVYHRSRNGFTTYLDYLVMTCIAL